MRKKQKRNLLYVVIAALVALAGVILLVPEMTVDSNTQPWLVDLINNSIAFREAFNGTVITIIGLLLVGALLLYQYSKTRKNKQALGWALGVFAAFGVYLLLAPGLAAAFADQQWLVDFSKIATDTNSFINDNSGFFTFIGMGSLVTFIGYRVLK